MAFYAISIVGHILSLVFLHVIDMVGEKLGTYNPILDLSSKLSLTFSFSFSLQLHAT